MTETGRPSPISQEFDASNGASLPPGDTRITAVSSRQQERRGSDVIDVMWEPGESPLGPIASVVSGMRWEM